jgi:hypothetical protein
MFHCEDESDDKLRRPGAKESFEAAQRVPVNGQFFPAG